MLPLSLLHPSPPSSMGHRRSTIHLASSLLYLYLAVPTCVRKPRTMSRHPTSHRRHQVGTTSPTTFQRNSIKTTCNSATSIPFQPTLWRACMRSDHSAGKVPCPWRGYKLDASTIKEQQARAPKRGTPSLTHFFAPPSSLYSAQSFFNCRTW